MTESCLVVFDCDGTLVDSQHMIFAAMQRSFGDLNLPTPELEKVRRIVGLNLVEGMAVLAPELEPGDHATLAAGYKAAFRDIRGTSERREPLFPGIRDTLESLFQGGYLLGIATGKSRVGLASILEVHELAGYFSTLQTADDAPGKPHPGMLERAMGETGVDPRNTVLIGDTVFDVEMAGHAGVAALGVSWGYHAPEELQDAGAHAIAATSQDLIKHIQTLLGDGPRQPHSPGE